jgi:galactitol 2-dehydrogenase (L-tagatose-forming)
MDYRNAFDMTGSVAVITGGGRGISFYSAVALGSCGAKVVLAGRDRSALDAAVKRLAETGVNAACAVSGRDRWQPVGAISPSAVRSTAR